MEISEQAIRDLRRKMELEVAKKEAEVTDHWRGQIEVVYRKKHDSMGSLLNDLKALMERMANRASALTRTVKEG